MKVLHCVCLWSTFLSTPPNLQWWTTRQNSIANSASWVELLFNNSRLVTGLEKASSFLNSHFILHPISAGKPLVENLPFMLYCQSRKKPFMSCTLTKLELCAKGCIMWIAKGVELVTIMFSTYIPMFLKYIYFNWNKLVNKINKNRYTFI